MTATAVAVYQLGARGADVDDMANSFDRLSSSVGESSDAMLNELRSGVAGTISDFDLMQQANKAMSNRLVTNAKDMGTLAAGARMLANVTGGETAEAFETLTSAMASGRQGQVKQLGLFVDTDKAARDFAASIGKSASKLTDHEKAQAVSAATLAQLRTRLAEVGPEARDFGEIFAAGKASVMNFVDNLGRAIAVSPVVAAGLSSITKSIEGAFGGNQQRMVETLVGWVNKFAIGLTYIASGAIAAADVMVKVFYGVKTVINGLVTGVVMVAEGIVKLTAAAAQAARAIPGMNDAVEGFAEGASDTAIWLEEVRKGMAAQTAEAFEGVKGNSAASEAIASVGGAVMTARDAMEAAANTPIKLGKSFEEMGKTIETANVMSVESAKKAVEKLIELEQRKALVGTEGLTRRLMELQFAADEEIRQQAEITDLSIEKRQELTDAILAAYDREREAAIVAGDSVRQGTLALYDELALMRATGTEAVLLDLEIRQQAEIDSIAALSVAHADEYEARVALIKAKYQEMTDAATGHNRTVEQLAEAAGFKTRGELEATAALALETYQRMAASGEYTASQVKEAWEKSEQAKREAGMRTTEATLEQYQMISSAASGSLRAIFGKNKAASIAAAVIDTAAAVVSSFKNAGGWPWGLVPAGLMAIAGAAQISKISSQSAGFKEGTPDLGYVDFGRQAATMLHGEEAVVPRAKGESLADQVMAAVAMGQGGGGEIRVVVNLDGQKVAESVVRRIPRALALSGVR